MKCQTLIVLWYALLAVADDYGKLTKLWSLNANDGSVTSASILIKPSYDASIKLPYARYAFKPRAMPKVEEQVEKNAYYSQDVKFKPRMLFSGNLYPIPKQRSNATERQRQARFIPVAIPLLRNEEFQGRSLADNEEESIIEKPEEFAEQAASRRSISDMLGVNDDDDDEDDDELEGEYEIEDTEESKNKNKRRKTKLKAHKMKKYMLPLLMAYKMKYFALVPVMIGGLILLVGATGMAGFFFALFAAVMALQKGGY